MSDVVVDLKVPSTLSKLKSINRPFLLELELPLDLKHEKDRQRYGFVPAFPHLYKGSISKDGRGLAHIQVYLPLDVDPTKIKIKIEELL